MMKKALFSLAALFSLLAPSAALSLPTDRTLRLQVEESTVARVVARNRVTESEEACLYTLRVTLTSVPLTRTVRCDILERKAGNDFDCERNRRRWFNTLITKGHGCSMFDEFGQQTVVETLTGGESSSGFVAGIFMAASIGDVQNFLLE